MTEDEAKTKWCPMSRVPMRAMECARNRGVIDNKEYLPEGTHCLGSGCMMWRWDKETIPSSLPGGYTRIVDSKTNGYCGLAK